MEKRLIQSPQAPRLLSSGFSTFGSTLISTHITPGRAYQRNSPYISVKKNKSKAVRMVNKFSRCGEGGSVYDKYDEIDGRRAG